MKNNKRIFVLTLVILIINAPVWAKKKNPPATPPNSAMGDVDLGLKAFLEKAVLVQGNGTDFKDIKDQKQLNSQAVVAKTPPIALRRIVSIQGKMCAMHEHALQASKNRDIGCSSNIEVYSLIGLFPKPHNSSSDRYFHVANKGDFEIFLRADRQFDGFLAF